MARLRNAVGKVPSAAQPRQAVAPAPQEPEQVEEKPRFGINSLINRMTGTSGEAAPQPVARQQPAARQQPSVQQAPAPAPAADPEQERIEIPAFLRRQAN